MNPFPLWEKNAPGALGSESQDIPTLTPYLPEKQNGSRSALLILPGGGYGGLADHEGEGFAEFFCRSGLVCFVLKYRLGSSGYRHPIMLQDAERALRTIRSRAEDYQIDPQKIGVIGSSAGGHLASTLLTHFSEGNPASTDSVERVSSRPDLGILCYPVITFGTYTHEGSKRNLLGENPAPELVRFLSNELQVTAQTPPCFVWHTLEDKAVPVENSLLFASSLRSADVPFDLHVYQKGGHGIGLGNQHPWSADALFWLKEQNFLP
jgi:acetyl esterase/lipase